MKKGSQSSCTLEESLAKNSVLLIDLGELEEIVTKKNCTSNKNEGSGCNSLPVFKHKRRCRGDSNIKWLFLSVF